jgi:hypothetical protein
MRANEAQGHSLVGCCDRINSSAKPHDSSGIRLSEDRANQGLFSCTRHCNKQDSRLMSQDQYQSAARAHLLQDDRAGQHRLNSEPRCALDASSGCPSDENREKFACNPGSHKQKARTDESYRHVAIVVIIRRPQQG